MVAGRRVKTVDVHSHCVVPGIMEMIGQKTPANAALVMGTDRLQQMDAQGIDVEVLSINPFWYAAERELAGRLIKTQNEQLSAFCAAHADRFVGLATVSLQHPDLAAEQLEDGMKRLGLRGDRSGPASTARSSRRPGSIRFGRKPRRWAPRCSSTRRVCPSCGGSRGTGS